MVDDNDETRLARLVWLVFDTDAAPVTDSI